MAFFSIKNFIEHFSLTYLLKKKNCQVNPRTYKGWRGVDATPTPFRFFWDFSKRIKHQHLTFSVTVRLSLARILRQVQWWSVSMVTRYDVISSRWSSHFEWKCMFFFNFFNNKRKNVVAKIMQSAYLRVIIHVKQLPFLVVLTWFLILCNGGEDGDHCWWRNRPPAAPPFIKYTSSC